MDTFSIIIRRISLTLVPKSSIPCLIQRIRGGDAGGVAERLIKVRKVIEVRNLYGVVNLCVGNYDRVPCYIQEPSGTV